LLWHDRTDAYGCGVAFFDKERLVEADLFLSPQKSEGWLICRRPETGERLWHYREAGMIAHPPLIDRRTGRVYGIFQRGEVVCLRIEDGSVVWKRSLPEHAYAAGTASSYDPAWSPHWLEGGRLAVVDANRVLHVLDAKTGDFLASVALNQTDPATPSPRPDLVARPWITKDKLLLAFPTGLAAFPLPAELQP
jgi:outer membrane protein assembly factor BamB